MKILVLSSIRCGGEYFTKTLAQTYGLKHIHEPNNIRDFGENICVKIHLKNSYSIDTIIEHSKLYDYIFILDRKNKEEQIKSAYTMYNITNNRKINWVWKDEYLKIDKLNMNMKEIKSFISGMHDNLVKISNSLNKEIIYYEDLYYNTESVNLNGLEFKPELSKRYYVEHTDKNKLI
jgi:hypothetical protein